MAAQPFYKKDGHGGVCGRPALAGAAEYTPSFREAICRAWARVFEIR